MRLRYILRILVSFFLTLSCSKNDSICGTWTETLSTRSAELTLNEDGSCLLSLDDPFTEGIDKEISGKWTRSKDMLHINYDGQYNSGHVAKFNILSLDDNTLELRSGTSGRILYFNRRE